MQITKRDIEIMQFINEFGFCEMPQIERRFGLKKPRNYKVMKRLIDIQLVKHRYVLRNKHGIYHLTRQGAGFTDLPELKDISLASYLHQLAVVNVHLNLMKQFPDATWIGERRLKRDNFLQKGFNKKKHVADGVLVLADGKQIAIEVELTMKAKDRLKRIMYDYLLTPGIHEVWYFVRQIF